MVEPNLLPAALGAAGGFAVSQTGAALVYKISDAIGWFTAPMQVRRMASAETVAQMIRVKSQIELTEVAATDLVQRAQFRVAVEQIVEEFNIEAIVTKALNHLQDDAVPQDMDDDWLRNFIGKCKNVSDEQIQELWARILAGEANTPGSYSRRAINVMGDLDSKSAAMFSSFRRFLMGIGDFGVPMVVLDQQGDLPSIYRDHGVDFNLLRELAELGLISIGFDNLSFVVNYVVSQVPELATLSYGGQTRRLQCSTGYFSVGIAICTHVGAQLSEAGSEPESVDGFLEFITGQWDTLCESGPRLTGSGIGLTYME